VRENAFRHTPRLGVVWDSKPDVCTPKRRAHRAVLPTKTSLWYNHLAGGSPSFLSAGSQVSSTSFLNLSVLVIFVAVTLSMVSHSLIARSHLALISLSVRGFSCMTLSHRRAHIRYADSDRIIWSSRVGPWRVTFLRRRRVLFLALPGWRVILPHPRIVPRVISGHGIFLCGHSDLASRHMISRSSLV